MAIMNLKKRNKARTTSLMNRLTTVLKEKREEPPN